MHCLYMGAAKNLDLKYVLILIDDSTYYSCLLPDSSPHSDVAAEPLFNWFSAFGSMEWPVSKRDPRFNQP